MVTNGFAVRDYGLMLCQDEATACTDLLDAFLAYVRTISDQNRLKTNIIEIPIKTLTPIPLRWGL